MQRRRNLRIWLVPFVILLAAAASVFFAALFVDSGGLSHLPLELLRNPSPEAAANAIDSAGEVIAAVLGIAITVVAIIVELSSNRYTPRVTELFIGEPINFAVVGFFVVSAIQAVTVGLLFDNGDGGSGFVPTFGIMLSLAMLVACLLLLLPYFAFVFDFLTPVRIVERIRQHTLKVVANRKLGVEPRKNEAVRGVEQLADVGMNAMEHKDKGVCMASVDSLRVMVDEYQHIRGSLDPAWFRVDGSLANDPDFVSMSGDVLHAVSRRKIWFEMKVLRKFQTLYGEALNRMRDICYVIAIHSRSLAEAALDEDNDELFEMLLKFFNTFLRATINARDVRTAYNVLHQYRLLAEHAIETGKDARAVEVARYFKYYGLTAFGAKLAFILETVAYDLCAIGELAYEKNSPEHEALLEIFLEVDKESESAVQEVSLRGVRKAQIKLATYYLVNGEEELARRIYVDMALEQRPRMASIRDELLNVSSDEFWEISDRGVNFDYLTPDRKAAMKAFFAWFPDLPRESLLPEYTPQLVAPVRGNINPADQASLHPPTSGPEPE